MDSFGSIGPEKPEYAEDVRNIARSLQGATVYVPLTDKKCVLHTYLTLKADLTPATGGYPPGLAEQGEVIDTAGWLFVAVDGSGAYWFDLRAYNAPSYVAAKLGLTNPDGETMAEFLTRLRAELRPMEVSA